MCKIDELLRPAVYTDKEREVREEEIEEEDGRNGEREGRVLRGSIFRVHSENLLLLYSRARAKRQPIHASTTHTRTYTNTCILACSSPVCKLAPVKHGLNAAVRRLNRCGEFAFQGGSDAVV